MSAERSFRARISDPIGPVWTRLLLPSLAVVTLVLDYLWAALDSASPGPAFYLAALLLLFARPLLGRHRSRKCELLLSSGRVRVRDAGLLNQNIDTADVSGASTSVGQDGTTTIAISRAARMGRPLHFVVKRSENAAEIRQALGIGFGGYGTLAWKVSGGNFELATNLARIAGGFAALVLAFYAMNEEPTSILMWLMLVCSLAVVYLGPFFRRDAAIRNGAIWFNDAGVFHGLNNKTTHIPYSAIEDVSVEPQSIRIARSMLPQLSIPLYRASHSLNGASDLEIEHIAGQLRDAGRRAHGELQASEAATGVELLMRSSADAPRAWLERLDGAATTMGGGYRSVNLTKESLLRALEDPDAAPDIRVGAARVLYRIAGDEATARVEEVCETVRDPALKKRLRVVMTDDLDGASAELEIEDHKEQRKG